MPVPDDLFVRSATMHTVPRDVPMVVLLTGFTDAGGTIGGALQYIRDDMETQLVAAFDADVLLDYRARRPIITVENNRLGGYRPPRLELVLATDVLGQPFLVLGGFEPDFAWNAFTEAVLALAREFEVASLSWAHAIAMPVPHTRQIGAAVSGTRSDVIERLSVWGPRTQVPATAGHLLEYCFAEADVPTLGFVILVPHYLAETDYPAATSTALDLLAQATGRVLDLADLAERNTQFLERVNGQIGESPELAEMIGTLESRYDTYMERRASGAAEADNEFDETRLPSADELAAELESYLASRANPDDERGTSA